MKLCRIPVKNTFFGDIEDSDGDDTPSMRRSCSDSNLSSLSSNSTSPASYQFWVPARSEEETSQKPCHEDLPVQSWNAVLQYHTETGTAMEDLHKLQVQGVLTKIPRNDEGNLSSLGSLQHFQGNCLPCIFWFKNQCRKGLTCKHCHFRHPGQKAKRHKPNKRARELMRQEKIAVAETSQ